MSGLGMPSSIPGISPQLSNSLKAALPGNAKAAPRDVATKLTRGQFSAAEGVPSSVPSFIDEIGGGKSLALDELMADDLDGSSAALARLERGRLANMQGNFGASIGEFDKAIDIAKEFEDRATVSLSAVTDQVSSLVVNDSVIDYEPAGFERVMMYHFQALNYLGEGKLEEAAVEVRRANDEQERALKAHEEEILEAEKSASSKGISLSDFSADIAKMLGQSKAVGSEVKNSFQNAYTFYMSGAVHELMDEPSDAYIDYKKALEIAPKNSFIQRDVARLAKKLEMTDDIQRFSKLYPAAFAKTDTEDGVDLIVLFEDGLVPAKEAITVPLPVPGVVGLAAFALPTYQASRVDPKPLTVKVSGADAAKTERICAIDSLAVKDFEEKAPAMITRQVIRTAIKGGATYAAGQYGGALGSLAATAYTGLTEKADTRSWQSLPQNAQVFRTRVQKGAKLDFVHASSGAQGSFVVPADSKSVVVRAIRVGPRLTTTGASF
jgi:hypothetical protein